MIELADTAPDINVQSAEYIRLLGYPAGWVLEGRALELAEWARDWYATNGQPWVYARQSSALELANASIRIDGESFTSKRLQNTLQQAEAHNVILMAVGAGAGLEREAQRLWQDEKPDEYFFLEMYGSAVVEHLVTMTGARLCAWAEGLQMAVLPHYSPGYPEWDIGEQSRLLALMRRSLPAPLEALDSGALRPKKSLLAVFGVTHHTDRVRLHAGLVPCENCSFGPCQYRRAPYAKAPESSKLIALPASAPPLQPNARYGVNARALKRWASERLSMQSRADGGIDAVFCYEGTTCSNMGRPLTFHYKVKLGPPEQGYPIWKQQCDPAPDDIGHTFMCRYDGGGLLKAVSVEKPLAGQPLDDVLSWDRPACSTGCYCEPAGREHKWGLVLETIHYALAHSKTNEY